MKLDIMMGALKEIAERKNHKPVTSVYGFTSFLNFCNKRLFQRISLKV